MGDRVLTDADVEAIAAAVARRLGGDEWLTPSQVAQLLGYHQDYVRRLPLPVHHYGRRKRYKRSEIEGWIKEHRTTP